MPRDRRPVCLGGLCRLRAVNGVRKPTGAQLSRLWGHLRSGSVGRGFGLGAAYGPSSVWGPLAAGRVVILARLAVCARHLGTTEGVSPSWDYPVFRVMGPPDFFDHGALKVGQAAIPAKRAREVTMAFRELTVIDAEGAASPSSARSGDRDRSKDDLALHQSR